METEASRDIGEEIMRKLRELEEKINKLIRTKNDNEFKTLVMDGNRT